MLFPVVSGAIFGALEVLASRSLSRETYTKTGIVPDWSSLNEADEQDEKLPTKR